MTNVYDHDFMVLKHSSGGNNLKAQSECAYND